MTNWLTSPKEGFVSFHSDITTGNNIGTPIYIPQYSVPDTKTVISLYDSIYYDYQNGTLIEVFAPDAAKTPTNDVTGSTITAIAVTPRDGIAAITYTSKNTGSSSTNEYSTPQSLVTSVNSSYNQFQYTSMNTSTHMYQAFYISWNTKTYIHLVNLTSRSNKFGTNLFTYTLDNNGLINSKNTTNLPRLPDLTSVQNNVTLANSRHQTSKYLKDVELYKIATVSASNSKTGNISYDIQRGNIVIDGTGVTKVYNRSGNGNAIDPTASSNSFTEISSTNVFIINDLYPHAAILVIANKYDTIISIITPSTSNYNLLTSVRFNKTQLVTNLASDTENNGSKNNRSDSKKRSNSDNSSDNCNKNRSNKENKKSGSKKYSGNKTDGSHTHSGNNKGGSHTHSKNNKGGSNGEVDGWNNNNWKNSNMIGNDNVISSVCGDEISCKWYWFFNSIGQNNHINSGTSGKNIISDDYFLKTEVVPPVCPQCPMCPDSGICDNCGGNGGSGMCTSRKSNGLTPSPTVPGTFTDASGNVFILYTDKNGNKSYVPQSSMVPMNAAAAGSNSKTAQNATYVDANGQFVTTADPNTLGGGLAISTMSLDQLGTSAFNNAGSLANNVVNTAGGLAGITVGAAADLAKGAGNGLMQLGSGNGGRGSANGGSANGGSANGVPASGGAVPASGGGVPANGPASSGTGYTPNAAAGSAVGNIPGKTPVDNYSYYGALQSKGGNYIPVTADFSSFRK